MKGTIIINKNYTIGKIDNRLYGSFIEHVGRTVYEGIYEPTHKTADKNGFRQDVRTLIQQLNTPLIRYPGGNFLSAYHWEDGIGPKENRPQKADPAWESIESNQVGIDDFQQWAKELGSDVMMAVNLGTRGAEDAANCLEYCNGTTNTYYADLRRKNGFKQPFGFKTWCLGNEMGGVWQIGRKTPEDYGKLAADTAKLMKKVDPSIELVVCGSSHRKMPRFGEWELTVLSHTYKYIDYISIHQYFAKGTDSGENYLAKSTGMNDYIHSVCSMCDSIKAIQNSNKTIDLSFDEWNVVRGELSERGEWQVAPHLFEHDYTFEDALAFGCMMMTLQNNCDRVKIACLAQLVNVIAPIRTETNGNAWVQTTYYPFLLASQNGRGTAMKPIIQCATYSTDKYQDVPYLESSVIYNQEQNEIAIFCCNRSYDEEFILEPIIEHFGDCRLIEHIELYCENLDAINTAENEAVAPIKRKIEDTIRLKKHSWNMLKFKIE